MSDAAAPALFEFRLPDLGEGVAESEIVRWLVAAGDELAEDQPMVEVMTDKATVEIPAPAAGRVARLLVEAGRSVPVGSVIVEIEAEGGAVGSGNRPVNAPKAAAPGAPAARSAPRAAGAAAGGRVQATPLVRRLASELGVDLASVRGSGPGGRVLDTDVRAAAGGSAPESAAPDQAGSRAQAPAPAREGVLRTLPLSGVRGQIAAHLTAAAAVPTVTVVEECELTAVNAARTESGLSFLPYLVRGLCSALRDEPNLNGWLDSLRRELVVFERIDIGIAVQTDAGLVVPVLRGADAMSLAELDASIADLAARATAGTLAPAELRGSTITVTSAGKLGGLFTTPLLNVPEVAILGLHRAEERAVVRDGEVVVRSMANLSVTFDHRANDGLAASRLLLGVINALQGPAL
jgi:pyruvate dehydrogenase E2 component (dihydrolipoamide acetyltransferase)